MESYLAVRRQAHNGSGTTCMELVSDMSPKKVRYIAFANYASRMLPVPLYVATSRS